jgi:hypothetical protein
MVRRAASPTIRAAARLLLGVLAAVVLAVHANAQTVIENSGEVRFQLDVRVPDAALAPLIPSGWSLNVATQGAAKDANLRVVFIDRVTVNAPDGTPIGKGSNRLVYLIAPVKDGNGANAQLVIGGLTEDPSDAPGPFGVYLHAVTHTVQRSTTYGTGTIRETQDWVFAAASGERLEMHIQFERGGARRTGPAETKFYSAKTPTVYQISKQEQSLEVIRNVTTKPPDRVTAFSFKGSGGSYAKLFDGTEQVVSWDNIFWVDRTVLVDRSN